MATLRLTVAITCLLSLAQAQALPLKIACIGDSITYGSGLSNPGLESYPAKLQRLLGSEFAVRNYGVSGRTLLKQGDFPYWKEKFFNESHAWAPDIVVIQLGTNDSKPYNWRYGTNFVSDYEEMVASYTALTNRPRVIVCTPCPVYRNGAYDIRPGTVATNIAPAVRDLAGRLGLELVDLHFRLADGPEWFPDTVHPNAKGMSVMTAVIYSVLSGESTPQPPPPIQVELVASKRIALTWPAAWRSVVVESAPALLEPKTAWTVAEQALYHSGDTVRQTNTISGSGRVFRLWAP